MGAVDAPEPLSDDEYTGTLDQAWILAGISRHLPLEAMLGMIAHAEAVTPQVDATLYREGTDRLREDRQLLELLGYVGRRVEKLPCVVEAVAAAGAG